MGGSDAKKQRVYDLEDRLIAFAVRIMEVVEALPKTRVANHVSGQLLRCGTSPAPNYGEAQGLNRVMILSISLKSA